MKPSHAFQVDMVFANADRKAVDFPRAEYERDKSEMDRLAEQNGYRLAGIRLERAVFTSKPTPQEEVA